NNKQKIAVLYHLFYEDTCESICHELQPLRALDTTFLFNICSDTPDKKYISALLRENFPSCFIIDTSNKGKDIGAKLSLLHLFLQLELEADYLLFLHDKKSLQALKSNTWKKELLKIIDPDNLKKIMQIFETNKRCGIVATKEYIIDEPVEEGQFIGNNKNMLNNLLKNYQINPPSFAFVAGTMFWARAKPMKDFFCYNSPLEIRKELEDGNVLDNFSGTITHSWERILSWIITGKGFLIKGI
ncbi:MAG TPA: rhamnan synthesis F family protein, partial [Chitinophagaceae bacterium]|nr:rhamnan synthesis F family protein [Chitinophagaceae bacterium]